MKKYQQLKKGLVNQIILFIIYSVTFSNKQLLSVGYLNFSAFVDQIYKKKAQVNIQVNDRILGSRDNDCLIFHIFSTRLKLQLGSNLTKKRKIKIILSLKKYRKDIYFQFRGSYQFRLLRVQYGYSQNIKIPSMTNIIQQLIEQWDKKNEINFFKLALNMIQEIETQFSDINNQFKDIFSQNTSVYQYQTFTDKKAS
ncbi:unnamed protein product [Paramecium pentaurelia]|uniref:Uncharacterized protein n=1 Tax=Paramecium pentaurelia TaxID=43138 RepID=A0A8S1W499_9CILI|nr:unnamed protein product [Paramecium pentaurelia]